MGINQRIANDIVQVKRMEIAPDWTQLKIVLAVEHPKAIWR